LADLNNINLKLHSLVIFRNLLSDELLRELSGLLHAGDSSLLERVSRYSAFAAVLLRENGDLAESLLSRVLEDENIYVHAKTKGIVAPELEECLQSELGILQEISRLQSGDIQSAMGYDGYLPAWKCGCVDFAAAYNARMNDLSRTGFGIFARHHMFAVKNGRIIPVSLPDPVRLSELKGYARERGTVVQNSVSLLKGKPAANVLLYGDAGTGKSSTVKAIANEYKDLGLRLIEINKKQFGDIPGIMEQLCGNPLKFILFIDDLSFDQNNDEFKALKAILEGSASAKAPNIAIYATSNRRHLVKESFSDRNGDDIHVNETIQELTSLSERFGLSVHFFQPGKELYLQIVHGLAEQFGLPAIDAGLDLEAERYALARGGRSPRVARQFIDSLRSLEK
jgi:predicted AAA+ superfamily ATPase